jgi:hypothetical protein
LAIDDKQGRIPADKVSTMKTAAKSVLKASLALVAGCASAGWLLFLLMMYLMLLSQA